MSLYKGYYTLVTIHTSIDDSRILHYILTSGSTAIWLDLWATYIQAICLHIVEMTYHSTSEDIKVLS